MKIIQISLLQYHTAYSYGAVVTPILLLSTADAAAQVGADVAELAWLLQKPLRPLWISQDSTMWLDDVPALDSLPFTPIILVSASKPNARQRCSTGSPLTPQNCSARQQCQIILRVLWTKWDIPGMLTRGMWFCRGRRRGVMVVRLRAGCWG